MRWRCKSKGISPALHKRSVTRPKPIGHPAGIAWPPHSGSSRHVPSPPSLDRHHRACCRKPRPAAHRHRPGRPPPQHHHRRPADRQLGLAGAVARAVERRPTRVLLPVRAADHPEPAGPARGDAGPGGELEAHRRAHRRVHPAQRREVPQRRRDDGRRRGLHLQPRAHVRAGLRHQLEQDAVHLGADPRFGRGQEAAARGPGRRQAPVPRPREGRGGRQIHGALHQPHARRHPRRPHRPHGQRHRLAPRLRPGQELDGLVARAGIDRPLQGREFVPDQSLMMDAHEDYWGGQPPLKSVRLVVVPEVATRINGLLAGQFDFICDVPPDPIPGIEKNPKFEVLGSTIVNHRLTVFDKNHPRLVDPRIRLAFTHAIDRKAIVEALWSDRTRVPAGLQWEFYGPMFVENWTVPAYDPAKARQLLKDANYKGEPIPYRLLSNYYTNQVATAQVLVEMWRQVGLNVPIEMKENWQQIFEGNGQRAVRDWSNSAGYNDPISSIVAQHGPQGQQQQVGEWTNEEMNKLSVAMEIETDMQKRKAMF